MLLFLGPMVMLKSFRLAFCIVLADTFNINKRVAAGVGHRHIEYFQSFKRGFAEEVVAFLSCLIMMLLLRL